MRVTIAIPCYNRCVPHRRLPDRRSALPEWWGYYGYERPGLVIPVQETPHIQESHVTIIQYPL